MINSVDKFLLENFVASGDSISEAIEKANHLSDAFARLKNGVVAFEFIKKDGTNRRAIGTTDLTYVPCDKHPKEDKKTTMFIQAYFDLQENEWRSFDIRRFVSCWV